MSILQSIQAIQTSLNSLGFGVGILGSLQPLLVVDMSNTTPEWPIAYQVVTLFPLMIILAQFVQFSGLYSGTRTSGKCGAKGFSCVLLAIAMLLLTKNVPDVLTRFLSIFVSGAQKIGRVISTIRIRPDA